MATHSLFTVMQSLTTLMVVYYLVDFSTGNNVAYINGNLTGCVTVKNDPTCGIDYPVPDYFATQYHHSLNVIRYILPKKGRASNGCREVYRKLFCGQKFPRCVNHTHFDFGNASSLCSRLLLVCSKPQDNYLRIFARLNYCKRTQNGLFKSDRCVDIPTQYSNTCAKGFKKIPIWIADRYRNLAKNNKFRPNASSISCKNAVQNAGCKIPFCSSDGKHVLNFHTKQKCMHVLSKCLFGGSSTTNVAGGMICNSYPDENKAKKIILTFI